MTYPGKADAPVGAPTDVGAGRRGASLGPEELRVAGIDSMLRTLDVEVKDLRNSNGPRNPSDAFRRCIILPCHSFAFARSLHSHANFKSFDDGQE